MFVGQAPRVAPLTGQGFSRWNSARTARERSIAAAELSSNTSTTPTSHRMRGSYRVDAQSLDVVDAVKRVAADHLSMIYALIVVAVALWIAVRRS